MVRIEDVLAARDRLRGVIEPTPCARSEALSRRTGTDLWVKFENLQITGSFKERGAAHKLLTLTPEERARGIVTASAGNHAQAVAHQAQRVGVAATIVMPLRAPLVKVSATRGYGAEVVLHGGDYDEAYETALEIARSRGLVFVHAFDDDAVIAGQGTLGLELLEQVEGLDAVVVPVGGGGLAAGIGIALASAPRPIALYGVEAAGLPAMRAAFDAGKPTEVPAARTLADGIAVRRVGTRPFELVRRHLAALETVEEEDIAEAILVFLELEKTVAEGAAAAALAAVLHERFPLQGKRVALVLSGGNIDVTRLARMIERGLAKSGRSFRARVVLPDVPGTLAALLATVARCEANVLEVHHDRLSARAGVGRTEVEIVLETRGFDHIGEIRNAMLAEAWDVET